MKKNGFTIVEMLGVLIIMGVLLLIMIPTIDSVLLKQRKKLYNEHLVEVKDALKLWGDINADKLPVDSETPTSVTLKELKLEGLIVDEFKNPITDMCYANSNTFTITLNKKMYVYNVEELRDGKDEDCIVNN